MTSASEPPPDRSTGPLAAGARGAASSGPVSEAEGSDRLNHCEAAPLSPPVDGSELLAAVRLGDRGAFRELYHLFGGELLALCERILHHRADAEDAVADVFWEVWQRRERYDATRGGARPYLMTLARSRAIDRLRSHAARPEARAEVGRRISDQEELTAINPSPDESAAHAETRVRVIAALAELDDRQRQAMELAYYEGLSHQQIADRLGAPLGTVKTHIRKGLMKLRYSLQVLRVEETP